MYLRPELAYSDWEMTNASGQWQPASKERLITKEDVYVLLHVFV